MNPRCMAVPSSDIDSRTVLGDTDPHRLRRHAASEYALWEAGALLSGRWAQRMAERGAALAREAGFEVEGHAPCPVVVARMPPEKKK